VARGLAAASDASAAVQTVIRAVCVAQGWDGGRFFRLDSAAGVLVGAESWASSEGVAGELREGSEGAIVRADAGLAGRACESGEPLWIVGAARSAGVPATALAHETGPAGAFVVPVKVAGQSIGALAFDGRSVNEPDERLLQALRSIGEQLGQFLHRRRAEDDLRRSEERYRRLTELAADWHWEQDVHFRYTRIVGSGVTATGTMLGKTLWELPGIAVSDEERAAHQAEVSAQWSFCDFEFAVTLGDGQLAHFRISGEPLYDAAGVVSGFHGTGLDITHAKRAQIAQQQADGYQPSSTPPSNQSQSR
jgi:PAS domain-containing protein